MLAVLLGLPRAYFPLDTFDVWRDSKAALVLCLSVRGEIDMKAMLQRGVFHVVLVLIAMALNTGISGAQTSTTAPSQGEVSFTKDVAPIVQQHCQECHRPNGIAPMSLLTYEEVRPFAKAMKLKVTTRAMPPWFIDPNVGITEFKNFGGLTNDEIATIAKWADAGAPRGNPADMPAPVKFEDEKWRIGEPELVAGMSQDFMVKANVPDIWW